jgi:DNA-directed RNA polymerase subunit RPC12/RpoP
MTMSGHGAGTEIPRLHRCPACRSADTDRVRRAGLVDQVVRVLGRRVYRCGRCGTRFYDLPAQQQQRPGPSAADPAGDDRLSG